MAVVVPLDCLARTGICSMSLFFSPSHDGTDSPPDADEVVVVLNNFKSKIIKVKVSLLPRGTHLLTAGKLSRFLSLGSHCVDSDLERSPRFPLELTIAVTGVPL